MFFCEYCEILKNTFLYITAPLVAGSAACSYDHYFYFKKSIWKVDNSEKI